MQKSSAGIVSSTKYQHNLCKYKIYAYENANLICTCLSEIALPSETTNISEDKMLFPYQSLKGF